MHKYTHVAEQLLNERTGVNLSVYFYGKRDSKPSQFLPCQFMSSNTSKVTISKAEPCGEPLCGGETTNGELKCVSTAMEFRWFGCVEVCVVRSVPVLGLKFFWGVHAGTIIIFIVVGGGDFSCQSSNSLY